MQTTYTRTRETWLLYLLLAYYAYLQASLGPVLPYLRSDLGLDYTLASLHLSLFAVGGVIAGLTSGAVARAGRHRGLWAAAAGMGAATLLLVGGEIAGVTLLAALLMGWIGNLVLIAVQAGLADAHGELRAVALTEANVGASLASLTVPLFVVAGEVTGLGWRAALVLPVLLLVVLAASTRAVRVTEPIAGRLAAGHGRLPGAFHLALALLFCVVAVEWCVSFWAATFLRDVVGMPAAVAVAAVSGFYAAMLAGRVAGSFLARRGSPALLLALALAVTALAFPLLWLGTTPIVAVGGLVGAGLGIGPLFPLALSLAVGSVPDRSATASARAVLVSALSVVIMPLAMGRLADVAGLRAALGLVPILVVMGAVSLGGLRRTIRAR